MQEIEALTKKVNQLEAEIEGIKMVLFHSHVVKPALVSFRGMATTKLSEEELDKSIEDAKKSLFSHSEEKEKCM